MSQASKNPTETIASADESRYLLFTLGSELYGTPLLGVREVIQPQKAKTLPNTVSHFLGLINIRGQIVGVVDLRLRFGYQSDPESSLAYLVFETETGPIAAVVDKVDAVVKIDANNLNKNPNIRSQVPGDYFLGIGTLQERLVTLIDLNRTLSTEEYAMLRKTKMAG